MIGLAALLLLLVPSAFLWAFLETIVRWITRSEERTILVQSLFASVMFVSAIAIGVENHAIFRGYDTVKVIAFWPFLYCLVATGVTVVLIVRGLVEQRLDRRRAH